ncbi:MAG: glycoside hydrolase family 24 protein, partial [Polyangiales bacterium]
VSSSRKALLDTIAYAEGTRGYSQDGYNVLFNFVTISSCNSHPNRTICSGGYCSTAAGRYQFLTTTWNSLKLPNFRPENQTQGAMTLIAWRKATVPSDRPLTATEFSNVMDRISYEWASLPPGRYGQPMKSMSTLRAQYCKFAGC